MQNVKLDFNGQKVFLTIDKPETLNALSTQVMLEIEEATQQILVKLNANEDLRCVIVTGSGDKAFVAGADISEMSTMSLFEARQFSVVCNRALRALETLPIPVVAAINGFALGGGFELALSCDIRIASDKAKLGFPETGLGIMPGSGGTQRLSRLANPSIAKDLIFSGRWIKADEALSIGAVNKVVPHESLMDEVKTYTDLICANAPIGVRIAKSAINNGLECDIETGLAFEIETFGQCFTTEDQKYGMKAFLEKAKEKVFKNK